jgi:hypothetical protein
MITQNNFTQLKVWIAANFDVAKTALGGDTVGTYDTDSPPNSAAVNLLDDLPSTATWLLNKVS